MLFLSFIGTCFGYYLVPILSLPVFLSGEVHMCCWLTIVASCWLLVFQIGFIVCDCGVCGVWYVRIMRVIWMVSVRLECCFYVFCVFSMLSALNIASCFVLTCFVQVLVCFVFYVCIFVNFPKYSIRSLCVVGLCVLLVSRWLYLGIHVQCLLHVWPN